MKETTCASLENSQGLSTPSSLPVEANSTNGLGPFLNESAYRLFQWFHSGSHAMSLERLIELQKLLASDTFVAKDVGGVDFKRISKWLGNSLLDKRFDSRDRWIEETLKVDVPLGHLDKESPLHAEFAVKQFFYRPLLGVIRSVFESKARSAGFVYEPYEVRFKSPYGGDEMSVYGELYWSKRFRDAHEEVQLSPREAGDYHPRAIVALQLWSDGMCASKFGNAKLWPAYLQFGNQTKYERSRPKTCYHIAHIPSVRTFLNLLPILTFTLSLLPPFKLPGDFSDFVLQHGGKPASEALQTHCRREVMQAVWKTLLTDDFLEAWKNGIVVHCGDGCTRRLFPRIFTYSADYPEK